MGSLPNRPQYPCGVPSKFLPDGTVQRFPGNTTVCHIPKDSRLQPALQLVYDTLKTDPTTSQLFCLLPPESWHMTIFDGVRDQDRKSELWPTDLDHKTCSQEESTAHFAPKLRALGLELEKEGLSPPYKMRVQGFIMPVEEVGGLGFHVCGITDDEEARMRRLREKLADTFGFRAANHYVYPFHVSIAYILRWADEGNGQERKELYRVLDDLKAKTVGLEFELGRVEYNTFDDMFAFPRMFYLGDME